MWANTHTTLGWGLQKYFAENKFTERTDQSKRNRRRRRTRWEISRGNSWALEHRCHWFLISLGSAYCCCCSSWFISLHSPLNCKKNGGDCFDTVTTFRSHPILPQFPLSASLAFPKINNRDTTRCVHDSDGESRCWGPRRLRAGTSSQFSFSCGSIAWDNGPFS